MVNQWISQRLDCRQSKSAPRKVWSLEEICRRSKADPARLALLQRTNESHRSRQTDFDFRRSPVYQQTMQHQQQQMVMTRNSKRPSPLTLHSRRQPSNRGWTPKQHLSLSSPFLMIALAAKTVRFSPAVLQHAVARYKPLNPLPAGTQRLNHCPAAGFCHCAEETEDSDRFAQHDARHDRATVAPTGFPRAHGVAAHETGAVNNAVWSCEESARAFAAPGASSRGASSVAWSGSASSDGGSGPAETPRGARLRDAVTAQLRVSAQHWSVSQARSRRLLPCRWCSWSCMSRVHAEDDPAMSVDCRRRATPMLTG